MGQRGPAKQAKETRRRKGTSRKNRDAGVTVPAGVPTRPDWLTARGTKIWRATAELLTAADLVAPLDATVLAPYCDAYDQMLGARAIVAKERITTETDKGNLIQHPAVGVMHKQQANLLTYCRQLGMTPLARTSLRPAGSDEDDDELGELEKDRAA